MFFAKLRHLGYFVRISVPKNCVFLFNESSLKSLTNDNIKNVITPKIHEAIKSINEGLKI